MVAEDETFLLAARAYRECLEHDTDASAPSIPPLGLEPGKLRASLTRAGEAAGDFDENEAMVITGRIVRILSLRPPGPRLEADDVELLAQRLLILTGFPRAATLIGQCRLPGSGCASAQPLCGQEARDLPFILTDDGEVEIFTPGQLRSELAAAGACTGEFDEDEAMVLTGEVLRVLAHEQRKYLSTPTALRLVQDVLLIHGHTAAARLFCCLPPGYEDAQGRRETADDAVRSYLVRLEAALTWQGRGLA